MISGPAGRFVGLRGPFLWVLAGFLAWCAEAGRLFGLVRGGGAEFLACCAEAAQPLGGIFEIGWRSTPSSSRSFKISMERTRFLACQGSSIK